MSKSTTDPILQKVLSWGRKSELIRTVLLVGSRGSWQGPRDAFSDYDLSVFTTDTAPFVQGDFWTASFGKVLIMLPEQVEVEEKIYPTRLIIFEEGHRIDFTFFETSLLHQMAAGQSFPAWMRLGHRVLIDKDGMAPQLPREIIAPKPPSEEAYQALVNEFFWESIYVAKYLYRQDIWPAKYSEWLMKDELLMTMLRWSVQIHLDWEKHIGYKGRELRQWLPSARYRQLEATFTGFDIADNRRSLQLLIALFREAAWEVGAALGYAYPHELEEKVLGYIVEKTGWKLWNKRN